MRILTPIAFVVVWAMIFTIMAFPYIHTGVSVFDKVVYEKTTTTEVRNIFVQEGKPEGMLKASEIEYPTRGTIYGLVQIPELNLSEKLVFGDSKEDLKIGVGHFAGSHFPGESSTCLIAGHNNNKFNALKNAKIGMEIIISTHYGRYVYRIRDIKVVSPDDTSAYDLNAPVENVILYTCYPFDVPGFKSKRLFVYGEYVSGPKIDIYS